MGLSRDVNGQIVQVLRMGTAQCVNVSGTSASATAVAADTLFVRLCATTDCFVSFTADATAQDMILPAGVPEYFPVRGGAVIRAKQVTAAGVLSVTECG